MTLYKTHLERIRDYLRAEGIARSSSMVRALGMSRSTLSLITSSLPPEFLRFGKASNTHYALLRDLLNLGNELPIFRVDEQGKLHVESKLYICWNQKFLLQPSELVFSGLPPHFAEMTPQGFMGRAFAQKYSAELNLPPRPTDWSNDHILAAIAQRGEDLPGNVILGQESARRFQKIVYHESKRTDFLELANAAIQGQPAGSSAGGEQPKFSVIISGRHRLVKFAGFDSSLAQKRWRDLLISEHHALQVLSEFNIPSAISSLYEIQDMLFLEIERFDRVGVKGRKAVLTLASIDDFYFGKRDQWSIAADRFFRAGYISEVDCKKMKLLDAFGTLIGDSDRHFHNLAFLPRFEINEAEKNKAGVKFELAPAFDKLPMMFAPVAGQIIEQAISLPVPNAQMVEVWKEATDLAREFWNRVLLDMRISEDFKKIAKSWGNLL